VTALVEGDDFVAALGEVGGDEIPTVHVVGCRRQW
jgi:hypothetical protein